ncbi:MAG TPA: hypothetical protein ENJ97_03160 [Planctomycetes bacterium]|nr:hypothetical protein [Planctomycetota bacterium]
MRRTLSILLLFLLSAGPLLRAGQDPVRRGLRLLEEGKTGKAYALLEEGVAGLRKARKEPPPELLYDLGLAALKSGKVEEARAAFLEAMVGAGGKRPGVEAFSGWGLGAALWRLAQKAEKAGPAGLDQALKLVEGARDAWIRALLRNPSLAPLRRNIERANKKIEELKKRKKEREKKKKEEKNKKNKEDRKKKGQSGGKKKKEENRERQKPARRKKKENPSPGKKEEKKKREQGREKKNNQKKRERPSPDKKKLSKKERRKLAMSPEQVKKLMDILKEMEKERARLEKALVPAPAKGGKGW